MKLKWGIILFLCFTVGLQAAKKGWHLGHMRHFKDTGDFNISVTPSNNEITVTIPSIKTKRFFVYRSTKKNGSYRLVRILKNNTYKDRKIKKNTTYYYVVVAYKRIKDNSSEEKRKKRHGKDDDDDEDYDNHRRWKRLVSNKVSSHIQQEIKETKVNFLSTPSHATVIINGKIIGKTPFKKKMRFGTYKLKINKKGYAPYENSNFTVLKDKKNEINITLEKNESILSIQSVPSGATVKLNKKSIGKTPLKKKINFGKYTLTIFKQGYTLYENLNLIINKRKQTDISVNLERNESVLNVYSTPPGATVKLNKKIIGKTPLKKRIRIGKYSILIMKQGYNSYQNPNLLIEKKEQTDVNVTLEKREAMLQVNSTPAGAVVLLNRKAMGKTPLSKDIVRPGKYMLTANLKGYKKIKQSVKIDPKKPAILNLVFEKEILKGKIRINSIPQGAEVFIDNVSHGKTPIKLKQIETGSHSIILRKKDFDELKKDIIVEPKKMNKYNLKLLKTPGYLKVISTPDKAKVFINGKEYGLTPFVSDRIPPGRLTIKVKKTGFKSKTEVINLASAGRKELNYTLDPIIPTVVIKEVNVSFNSTPKNAVVIINNQNIGNTPVKKKFKLGTYQLTIQKEGYKTYRNFNFNVEYKPNMNVNVNLEKKKAVLQIMSTPSGADIKLNGRSIGMTPVTKDNLEFGKYSINARLSGYKSLNRVVILDSETPPAVNLNFEKEIYKGNVRINSTPSGADVYIDNVKKGRTPITINNQVAGIHTLVLKKNKYNELKKEIEVEADKTKLYDFTLSQEHAFISFTTIPDKAQLFLNGQLIGLTPIQSYKVSAGSHNVLIKKEDYSDFSEMMSIKVGDQIKRDIILSSEKSTLSVNTFPDKAALIINGMNYGITPFISDNMQPGPYKMSIHKDGFHVNIVEFELKPGEKEALTFTLDPIEQQQVVVIKKGTLSVSSFPANASVYINNKLHGNTPLIVSLNPATYSIKVRKANYIDWTGSAQVNSEDTSYVNANLTLRETTLSVNSSPQGASVYLNNMSYGSTPARFKIPAGNHVIRLTKDGYEDASATLRVTGNENQISRFYNLAKEVNRFNFSSSPRGAEVLMNNRVIGVTPFQMEDIRDGRYQFIYRKKGYRETSKNVSINNGYPNNISAKLEAFHGDLLVNTIPGSCKIYMSGSKIGNSGQVVRKIRAGYHNITVKKYGYYDLTSRIRIEDRQQSTYSFQLTEKPKGNIDVSSMPQGAKIYLENKFKGVTPFVVKKIPEDKYDLRLKKSGYKSFYSTVYVKGDQTEYVNAQLVEGRDCLLGNSFVSKPAFWYLMSGLCLVGSGYAWYEEDKAIKDHDKRRFELHEVRNGLAYASGGCLLIGLIVHITY